MFFYILILFITAGQANGWILAPPLHNNHALPLTIRTNKLYATVVRDDSSLAKVDNRPFDQRVDGPRTARRMNHAFRHLYRHNNPGQQQDDDAGGSSREKELEADEFLVQAVGYTTEQVQDMNQTFPPLLELSVKRHLRPKLSFLTETMNLSLEEVREHVPPQYFGSRLERIVAPRHSFLMHNNLTHGRALILNANQWRNFLVSCRRPKQFCALCNEMLASSSQQRERIHVKEIEAWDVLFQRGLLAAARHDLKQSDDNAATSSYNFCYSNHSSWPLQHLNNITSDELIRLLIHHGANPLELDARGASLLHWAAGHGHVDNCRVLMEHLPLATTVVERDGATALHWAAAGANGHEFGIGGHVDLCRYMLGEIHNPRKWVNQQTKDGNSALMWSAWAGTLEVVKLLVRYRADALLENRNGCTVAHWAASGGNLECCQYLYETVGVDFSVPNYGGNTPLTHAVAFGRADVVDWLRTTVLADKEEDGIAASLAKDFVGWTGGSDTRRSDVLALFEDWYGGKNVASEAVEEEEEEDFL